MPGELHGISALFYRRLSADTALTALVGTRIHEEFGPPADPYPRVLITFLAATDTNAIGADQRIFTRPLLLVEALTTDTNWITAAAIDTRVDQLLTGFAGTFGTLDVRGTYREAPYRRVEITPEGTRINHLGGRFRCFLSYLGA